MAQRKGFCVYAICEEPDGIGSFSLVEKDSIMTPPARVLVSWILLLFRDALSAFIKIDAMLWPEEENLQH